MRSRRPSCAGSMAATRVPPCSRCRSVRAWCSSCAVSPDDGAGSGRARLVVRLVARIARGEPELAHLCPEPLAGDTEAAGRVAAMIAMAAEPALDGGRFHFADDLT